METIKIWDKEIGDGCRPYFVAELGTCHLGSVEIAKTLAKESVEAGANCVKTETFYETEIYDDSIQKVFSIRGKQYSMPLREHMRECQLTLDQHHEIKKYCDELGVPFISTAHEFEAVDFLADIGAVGVKIASPDIVHIPLIRHVAKTNLVMIIDTGGAYQYEVEMAVKAAKDAGCKKLLINHNPSGHPAPAEKHDLRIIPRFKELFDCPIGIADHYDGYEMVYAAVAVGANLVEKPISQDRFIEKCEHIWAVSVKDLKEVILNMHKVYDALGNKERVIGSGLRPANIHRVALVAKRDLQPDDEIKLENIAFGKPRLGIGVEHWDILEGSKFKTNKPKGSYLQWNDIQIIEK